MKKLSPQTEDQNKNERVDWISMNVPVVEEKIRATIRIYMKEATIELDMPFTPQVLLQVMQSTEKMKQTNSNSKIYEKGCLFWNYLTHTLIEISSELF
ncbi:hypothetical protein [Bacillus pseudomycoides]|uniref:hypothetical protein n=1 Tax=Bacillus pseudomycoides TaxID=64104 RepID=UPI001FB55144|nr:hypothetical protein [Bacillus pseudomycoides]